MTLRDRFARLFRPAVRAVGLEIGTANLKVVELEPGTPPRLAKLAMRPMPPGLVDDDHVTDPEGLAREVGTLFDDAGIDAKHVVTAVGNRQAITRNIEIPRMSRAEVAEAIRWEAERYVPFPIDEVALDYDLLDDPDDVAEGDDLQVVIAAARLDLLREHVHALELAGLEPVVMDVKPFALLRSLKGALLGEHLTKRTLTQSGYTEGNEIGVVLEIAASATTITLVRGDRVLMNRNIGVSGDDFTTALQRRFGLEFDDAERLKLERGRVVVDADAEASLLSVAASDDDRYPPKHVYEALRPVLTDLTTEIRRSLEFFRVQSGDATIARMFLSGGGAKLAGLPDAVSDALGIRVRIGHPWLSVVVDERRFDATYLETTAPEFGVPLGLALRGVSGP
ncbi:MAG: type IV pilus assembly protein PilM [Trueperaceae bacterium]|nr:type IV pilus assembly protein PilM [Trueperaceae bacterium]